MAANPHHFHPIPLDNFRVRATKHPQHNNNLAALLSCAAHKLSQTWWLRVGGGYLCISTILCGSYRSYCDGANWATTSYLTEVQDEKGERDGAVGPEQRVIAKRQSIQLATGKCRSELMHQGKHTRAIDSDSGMGCSSLSPRFSSQPAAKAHEFPRNLARGTYTLQIFRFCHFELCPGDE